MQLSRLPTNPFSLLKICEGAMLLAWQHAGEIKQGMSAAALSMRGRAPNTAEEEGGWPPKMLRTLGKLPAPAGAGAVEKLKLEPAPPAVAVK
jgi:hypothetical protein